MRWVIGDVHGMRLTLESLLAAVGKRDPSPRFLFAGDYVNRGPDARGVLDLLLALPDATFVRGNHDDVLDVILHGRGYCDHPTSIDRVGAFRWFMQHGLAETLVSYGADHAHLAYAAAHPSEARVSDAVEAIPAAHRAFIRGLPPVHEEPDLFVAHAMWDPHDDPPSIAERLAASPPDRFRVLWGRYAERDVLSRKRWRRTGYFGHTPVQSYRASQRTPLRGPSIVLLDTGAALAPGGRLSAVCHETGECVQVDRAGRVADAA
jgi:serine/threonine protein phosphatase 1